MPIKRIARRLRVSPSSVLTWTSDVQLTPEQREANLRGPHGPQNPEQVARRADAIRRSNGLSLEQIEGRWLTALGLFRSCLRKHFLNPTPSSSSGRKTNKLPYGVCTLSVYDTRIVQHIYGAIQEYAGFEEPRWLGGPPRRRKPR